MADVDFDGFDGGFGAGARAPSGTALYINVIGAVTSISLIVGLGFWGYKLAVRDMTGIPVVRALEGPMRVAPQDPGGVVAAHQGLLVNSVAAEGSTSPPADRLVLAPRPVDLSADDAAGTLATPPAPVSGRPVASPGLSLGEVLAAPETAEPPAAAAVVSETSVLAAISDALSEDAIPLSGSAEIAESNTMAPAIKLPQGALSRSPRPMPRPGEIAPLVTMTATDVAETDGEALAKGTKLVQLGAFDSTDDARKEWDRLVGKFGDLLVGKTRVVQDAKSGGRTFYRLRAEGFADDADARRFCSALAAERAACIPVTVR